MGKGKEKAFINGLMKGEKGALFEYAEPDCIESLHVMPNDPRATTNYQWHHAANIMDSAAAWNLETGSASVTVAICDTGLDVNHPDLMANKLEGYHATVQRWESEGGDISHVHPHGTNCVGCAAAIGNNGIGIAGVG